MGLQWFFFTINICTVFHHGGKSADAEGQLYALIYTISYKGLEHQQILLSVGIPGANTHRYQGTTVLGEQKVIHRFLTVWGIGTPNTCIVQGSTVVFYFVWGRWFFLFNSKYKFFNTFFIVNSPPKGFKNKFIIYRSLN